MPYSSNDGKQHIKNILSRVRKDKVLDIGVGSGTYAKMLPSSDVTGIEIWSPYIEKFELDKIYKKLIIQDARTVDYEKLGHFDLAIAGDVLEHMSEDEAREIVRKIRLIADTVIISIPIGHYPQSEVEGNPYEAHVVDNWTNDKFIHVFGKPDWSAIDGEIGVYCWSDQKVAPKICVYTITKNEEKFVKRWADSAREADLLLMADTGSTDKTVEICKQEGVVVHEICITPWRFDHARNANIALIPKDIDICICMDADEVLEAGWRQEIEKVWVEGTTRLRYMFDWGSGIKFQYEKIHARHGYYWHHPCHEYPTPDGRINEQYAYTQKLLVSHHPDPTKSRGQYLDLLALSVKEDPRCPRNAFYYARELSFYAKWEEALTECRRYLALPTATWGNERCYAYRVMGKCYENLGNLSDAEKSYQNACGEAPNTREPWCSLSLLMYTQHRWEECFAYAIRALRIKDRELVYTCDPAVWGAQPHDLASISAWHLGLKDLSLEHAKLAAEKEPNDDRLQSNLKWIEEAIKKS